MAPQAFQIAKKISGKVGNGVAGWIHKSIRERGLASDRDMHDEHH
jgi:hypothetical protein